MVNAATAHPAVVDADERQLLPYEEPTRTWAGHGTGALCNFSTAKLLRSTWDRIRKSASWSPAMNVAQPYTFAAASGLGVADLNCYRGPGVAGLNFSHLGEPLHKPPTLRISCGEDLQPDHAALA